MKEDLTRGSEPRGGFILLSEFCEETEATNGRQSGGESQEAENIERS